MLALLVPGVHMGGSSVVAEVVTAPLVTDRLDFVQTHTDRLDFVQTVTDRVNFVE